MEPPLLIAQIISQGQTNFVKEIASMIFFQIIGVSIKLSSYGSGGATMEPPFLIAVFEL